MIEKDPDDSVLNEQSGANENASGTESNAQNEKTGETGIEDNTGKEEKTTVEGAVLKRKRQAKKESDSEFFTDDPEHPGDESLDDIELPPVDYSGFSKNELVETLALIIENRPPAEIRNDVDRIKVFFYKKLKQEAEDRKTKFLEGGGTLDEYRSWVDPLEARVKHLLEKYREKKTDFNRIQEAEKYENLKKKYDIIDKIKDLVNREESINKTFQEFRTLQNEWHSIGVVPQNALKDLWENYHHHVEIFYDYIKINKELRDLDLKKNLETKVQL